MLNNKAEKTKVKCEICEEQYAVEKCSLCGRWVCRRHISNGICAICKSALCELCNKNLSIGYCKICGRLVCEDCTVKINSIEYVCVECYRRMSMGQDCTSTSFKAFFNNSTFH